MDVLSLILLVLAAVCFVVTAAELVPARVNLMAAGLFFWVLVPLIAAVHGVGH